MTTVARRIRAAMELAGISGYRELAERIDRRGFSEDQIRAFATDGRRREPEPHELAVIARACDLPVEFFEIDFGDLSAASPELRDRVARLEEAVDGLLDAVRRLGDELPTAPPPPPGALGRDLQARKPIA